MPLDHVRDSDVSRDLNSNVGSLVELKPPETRLDKLHRELSLLGEAAYGGFTDRARQSLSDVPGLAVQQGTAFTIGSVLGFLSKCKGRGAVIAGGVGAGMTAAFIWDIARPERWQNLSTAIISTWQSDANYERDLAALKPQVGGFLFDTVLSTIGGTFGARFGARMRETRSVDNSIGAQILVDMPPVRRMITPEVNKGTINEASLKSVVSTTTGESQTRGTTSNSTVTRPKNAFELREEGLPSDRNSDRFQSMIGRQLGIDLAQLQAGKIAILHPRFTRPEKQLAGRFNRSDIGLWGSAEQGVGVVEYMSIPSKRGYLSSAPSVVRITKRTGEHTPSGHADKAGSGVFVSAEGKVATNAHVIDGATSLKVETYDGRSYSARVLDRDDFTDLAILQLVGVEKGKTFPTPEFAELTEAMSGARVAAVGHHGGLKGVIASPGQFKEKKSWTDTALYALDSIVPGASGSPVFDLRGRLVGLVASTYHYLPGKVTGPSVEQISIMLGHISSRGSRRLAS
ncbi:MAG TPA: serine protease [Candidatus Obscuribacterales bacterium]